jgi:hypothetical protein
VKYDPAEYFAKKADRQEPAAKSPLQYRARTFSDVAVRTAQTYRGVPATAPRGQGTDLCRRCGEQRADHRQQSPVRACPRFVSPFQARTRKKGTMTKHQNLEGETSPMIQEVKHQISTRTPTTGLTGTADEMAEQLFQAIRLLTQDCSVGQVSAATGLRQELIAALADRFW